MKKWWHGTIVSVLALGTIGAWPGAIGAQAAAAPFCTDRSSLAAAVQTEDPSGVEAAMSALSSNAPPEIAAPVSTLADLVVDRGNGAFTSKKGRKALKTIDAHVASVCGFPVLQVTGNDYLFEGITSPMAAGTYVVQFVNGAPAEHHELVLTKVDASLDLPLKKLLAGESHRLATVGALFAKPGKTDTLVVVLEPGRHVYACFIDVNTTSGDAADHGGHGDGEHGSGSEPHWREGMRGEVEVVGGA
jgi:hypothetical protein